MMFSRHLESQEPFIIFAYFRLQLVLELIQRRFIALITLIKYFRMLGILVLTSYVNTQVNVNIIQNITR